MILMYLHHIDHINKTALVSGPHLCAGRVRERFKSLSMPAQTRRDSALAAMPPTFLDFIIALGSLTR